MKEKILHDKYVNNALAFVTKGFSAHSLPHVILTSTQWSDDHCLTFEHGKETKAQDDWITSSKKLANYDEIKKLTWLRTFGTRFLSFPTAHERTGGRMDDLTLSKVVPLMIADGGGKPVSNQHLSMGGRGRVWPHTHCFPFLGSQLTPHLERSLGC